MDTVDRKTRSRIMANVRSKDTSPELQIRKALHKLGFRYRLHPKNLPGHPDLVLPKYKAVIFVHGCFWHRHGCHMSTTPKTRQDFWNEKFAANVERDRRVAEELRAQGWKVLVVWECVLKGKTKLGLEVVVEGVVGWLASGEFLEDIPAKKPRSGKAGPCF